MTCLYACVSGPLHATDSIILECIVALLLRHSEQMCWDPHEIFTLRILFVYVSVSS